MIFLLQVKNIYSTTLPPCDMVFIVLYPVHCPTRGQHRHLHLCYNINFLHIFIYIYKNLFWAFLLLFCSSSPCTVLTLPVPTKSKEGAHGLVTTKTTRNHNITIMFFIKSFLFNCIIVIFKKYVGENVCFSF